jgi:hypothetical protein
MTGRISSDPYDWLGIFAAHAVDALNRPTAG